MEWARPERVPGEIVARVQGQGLDEILDGLVDVALVEIEQPEVVLVLGVLLPGLLDLLLLRRAEGQTGADVRTTIALALIRLLLVRDIPGVTRP